MTEAEWVAGDDPAVMLRWLMDVRGGVWRSDRESRQAVAAFRPRLLGRRGDRMLRRIALACWAHCTQYRHQPAAVRCAYDDLEAGGRGAVPNGVAAYDLTNVALFAVECNEWGTGCAAWKRLQERKPPIIRDVAGNPWRPVAMSWRCGRCGIPCGPPTPGYFCVRCGASKTETVCPWVTPTVLSLAQAAYEETGRMCGRCGGHGDIRSGHPMSWPECPDCGGTGRVEDTTLDPVRLMVLADALEEAGCVQRPCLICAIAAARGGPGEIRCGCVESDLLAHLRSPGVHVRGCWAVDLLLGKY